MDARRYAPAAARNREPILAVLRRLVPETGLLVEIASGTGEHVVHLAQALSQLDFQPSDLDANNLESIDAWRAHARLDNVKPAIALDATAASWPITGRPAVILCCNMIHIAPWEAALGLVRGAARELAPGGLLLLYGPFRRGGEHTAESNQHFDTSLRERDARWGVRDLEDIEHEAATQGLELREVVEMPANNLIVVLRLRA